MGNDEGQMSAIAQLLGEISALRYMVENLYALQFLPLPDPAGAAADLGREITKRFDVTFERPMEPFEASVAQFTLAALERSFDAIEERVAQLPR